MFDKYGPCEDDYEVKCPYVNMLPEESYNTEDGSPLDFNPDHYLTRQHRIGDNEEPEEEP